jgi:hypothetical protein
MEVLMIFLIARIALNLVSAIFGIMGLLNLGGSIRVRAVYRLWHYPHQFYPIVGLVELIAALFLIVPETRVLEYRGGGHNHVRYSRDATAPQAVSLVTACNIVAGEPDPRLIGARVAQPR